MNMRENPSCPKILDISDEKIVDFLAKHLDNPCVGGEGEVPIFRRWIALAEEHLDTITDLKQTERLQILIQTAKNRGVITENS